MTVQAEKFEGMPTTSRFLMLVLGLMAAIAMVAGLLGGMPTGSTGRSTFVISHLRVVLVIAVCWRGSRSIAVRAAVWATLVFITSILAIMFREPLDLFHGVLLVVTLMSFLVELRLWHKNDLRQLF